MTSARRTRLTPAFRRLLSSQFVAQAGDGFAQATFADILVLEPRAGEDTAARLLALFALTLIPYSLLAPIMGVFVDRWDRRKLLVGTNVARALLLTTIPLWRHATSGDLALLAGLLVLLAFGRLFLTTKSAVLPGVTGHTDLVRANAVSGGGGMISALAGGAVGIAAVGLIGTDGAFVAAGASYAAAALLALRIHPRRAERIRESVWLRSLRVLRDLGLGMTEIARRPPAMVALAGIFMLRTIGMCVAVAAIIVIKSDFPGAGDRVARLSSSALALGSAGAGAFAGAVVAAFLKRRTDKAYLMLLGYVVSGASVAVLGGVQDMTALLALTFIGGFGGFVTKVAVDALLQESLPDAFRGRGFALYDILYNLASVAAAALIFAFDATPLRSVLLALGVITLAVTLPLAALMRRVGMFDGVAARDG